MARRCANLFAAVVCTTICAFALAQEAEDEKGLAMLVLGTVHDAHKALITCQLGPQFICVPSCLSVREH